MVMEKKCDPAAPLLAGLPNQQNLFHDHVTLYADCRSRYEREKWPRSAGWALGNGEMRLIFTYSVSRLELSSDKFGYSFFWLQFQ